MIIETTFHLIDLIHEREPRTSWFVLYTSEYVPGLPLVLYSINVHFSLLHLRVEAYPSRYRSLGKVPARAVHKRPFRQLPVNAERAEGF